MTEAEWLASDDPTAMLDGFPGTPSKRKLRLLGCAVCRRFWDVTERDCREAIEASERFADGLLSERELDQKSAAAQEAFEEGSIDSEEPRASLALAASDTSSPSLPQSVLTEAIDALSSVAADAVAESAAQADLLRDVFGNPFRTVALNPDWLTSDVLMLARGIYDEKAFDRMPILADALQDAGCDNPDVLTHCRDVTQVHARGCWAIDLVLGKA